MKSRILVIGSGFAGMWSAIGAIRLLEKNNREDVEVALIAPEPFLHIRPRLYENNPEEMKAPLAELFNLIGVRFIPAFVKNIDVDKKLVTINPVVNEEKQSQIEYDRLVLAAGSQLYLPLIQGLKEYSFSVDQISEASRLENHLKTLGKKKYSETRNRAVVVGAGFTGLEVATELPKRMRDWFGEGEDFEIILVSRNESVAEDLGPGPQQIIIKALKELGIICKTGSALREVTASGVILENGEFIESDTVIWTGGARANSLTLQIPGSRDDYGRLHVDRNLKVIGIDDVYATGDCALALTDDEGHFAMMSCQHANFLGRSSGHNVAADFLGVKPIPYSQLKYVTCLSLGDFGAVYSEGWDREVKLIRETAGELKKQINTIWIYPPKGTRSQVLEASNPEQSIPDVDI